MQQTLIKPKVKYCLGRDNKVQGDMQRIRITQGCINQCEWCYEPLEVELYLDVIDEIQRNKVVIIDMNIIDPRKPRVEILNKLIDKRVNDKIVRYDMQCGFDFRYMTQEIADIIYNGKFGHFNRKKEWVREAKLAWDKGLDLQYKFIDAVKLLLKAGFKQNQISVFMLTNHKVPMWECDLKLDLLKKWNMRVNDCCFDGGYKIAIPKDWTKKEIEYFRHKCAIHNQMIGRGIYPDLRRAKNIHRKW